VRLSNPGTAEGNGRLGFIDPFRAINCGSIALLAGQCIAMGTQVNSSAL